MKQVTIRVEAFTTVTVPDDWDRDVEESIPIKLDVYDSSELEGSQVEEVIETEITTKEIISEVDL